MAALPSLAARGWFQNDLFTLAPGAHAAIEAALPAGMAAAAVARHMKNEQIEIEVNLGTGGAGSAQVIGIDLGPGYIKENSVTS